MPGTPLARKVGYMSDYRHLFISHAGADKEEFITPLTHAFTRQGLSYWLDSEDIKWGDSVVRKVNEGLAKSRFVLLCLSKNYLARPWPESEMDAALSAQNDRGIKRVLPLILNGKEQVLRSYPLIAALAYREFDSGPDSIAAELAGLLKAAEGDEGLLQITVESAHTGQSSTLTVPPRASVGWLLRKVKEATGVRDTADAGAFEVFKVRWVLVDSRAESSWENLPPARKRRVWVVIKSGEKVALSMSENDRLDALGVYDKIVLHLHAVPEPGDWGIRYRRS